ncbi:hypothetical protein BGZ90_008622, partial [Linnemannia elongata]
GSLSLSTVAFQGRPSGTPSRDPAMMIPLLFSGLQYPLVAGESVYILHHYVRLVGAR